MSLLEWRHYVSVPGRADEVERRFVDHTFALLRDHGMEVLTFGRDTDDPDHFHYVVAWRDEAEMEAAWAAFADDERWRRALEQTEANGPIVAEIRRRFLRAVPH
jgi:heme-degrading monooxygenase HmoA